MKKIVLFFLIFLFVNANSGVALKIHWCGGSISSVKLFSVSENPCKCGKRIMKPLCCKDQTLHIKANNELVKVNLYSIKDVSALNLTFFETSIYRLLPQIQRTNASGVFHPPPLASKTEYFIRFRTLLI